MGQEADSGGDGDRLSCAPRDFGNGMRQRLKSSKDESGGKKADVLFEVDVEFCVQLPR